MRQKKLRREPSSQRGIAWPRWTGFRGKTVWDFLQLLIVPLMLAAIGFWFTAQQDTRQQEIEAHRAQAERELAVQRAQDEALQAYLDQMSTLILNRKLLESETSDPVYTLAQARTATAMTRLDAAHNRSVVRFLSDSGLSDVLLKGIVLEGADLRGINLANADLSHADLSHADLSGAGLFGCDLGASDLSGADLSDAFLGDADLGGTNLDGTDFSHASLYRASLNFTGFEHTNLSNADLSNADLSYAAWRNGVSLSNADLSAADLSHPIGPMGMSNEELEQEVSTLGGATMPDSTIHAGRYDTLEFEPAVSFKVSDGWRLAGFETSEGLFITPPEGGELGFAKSLHVFDPENPSEPKQIPAPENADKWAS